MSDSASLESRTPLLQTVELLDGFVTDLEHAVARRERLEASRTDADTERSVMDSDRTRLALELDSAHYQLTQLSRAAHDIDTRIEQAMMTIRTVLERAS